MALGSEMGAQEFTMLALSPILLLAMDGTPSSSYTESVSRLCRTVLLCGVGGVVQCGTHYEVGDGISGAMFRASIQVSQILEQL